MTDTALAALNPTPAPCLPPRHLTLVTPPEPPDDPLVAARAAKVDAEAAERRLLRAAAAWATAHSVDDPSAETAWGDSGVAIAGPGTPEVSEFSVAEFAAALGLTPRSGRSLLGEALEVVHRLPSVWQRVEGGDLPAWRARRVAQQTLDLPADGAAYVDRHVHAVAHKVGPAQLDRLVDEARVRSDPVRAEELRRERSAARHLEVDLDAVRHDGTVHLEGVLDLLDAWDLEHAVRRGAEQLRRLGCDEPLAVRRSLALGAVARGEVTLDLTPDAGHADRELGLSVHVQAAALDDTDGELARVDGVRSFVSAEQVRAWCGRPGTKVVVRPVLDADAHVHVGAYEVTDRLRDLTAERDRTCVFPHCTVAAARCDRDHVVPHDAGGATCSCNLAPLCRRHHRLKTFSEWSYVVVEPGTYRWTSPRGLTYVRDHTGTREVR